MTSKSNTDVINLIAGVVIHILTAGVYAYKLHTTLKEKKE